MHYFFSSEAEHSGQKIELAPEESTHAVKILRHKTGDVLQLLNGRGKLFSALITKAHAKKLELEVKDTLESRDQNSSCTIGLALLKKKERVEWFTEKAVESGAASIIFFTSEHAEKSRLNMERLHKIAINALKQSGNLWLPEIELVGFDFLLRQEKYTQKLIAHCKTGLEEFISEVYKKNAESLILIGPEGDFSDKEISEAEKHGFIPVNLGENRLRAETAALTVLIQAQLLNRL